MKICKAKVTASKMYKDKKSLRGEDIRDLRDAINDTGFKVGDKVVIVLAEDFERLLYPAEK